METTGGLNQVCPGWWTGHSRLFHTNSAIFTSNHEAILIDPGIYPDEIETIANFIVSQELSLRAVVLTHSHWDHILGQEQFPNTLLITHQAFLTTAAATEDILRRELNQWEKQAGVIRRRAFRLPRPDLTFDVHMIFQVGDEAIVLRAAPGHAADQLILWHPNRGLLWAADMLSDLEIPFVAHSLVAYQQTLRELSGFNIRVLIPGHGTASDNAQAIDARLKNDRAYLAELEGLSHLAVSEGRTMEETIQLCQDIPYPQDHKDNAGPHRLNIESAYLEAGGNAPADSGWSQVA